MPRIETSGRRGAGPMLWMAASLLIPVLSWSQTQAAAPSRSAFVGIENDTLVMRGADGVPSLRVSGYLQGDARLYWRDLRGQARDNLLFRRIRPTFEFNWTDSVQFRLMPDFGRNEVVLEDAYIEIKTAPPARLRIGKFKTPFGLENLRQDREATFVERGLTANLVPLRDLGVQLSGTCFRQALTYAVGYFMGTRDGANGTFDWSTNYDVGVRLFLHPLHNRPGSRFRTLGIGAAGSGGRNHGTMPSFKTVGQNTFFQYFATAKGDGRHTRIVPQAYLYSGRYGVLAEYVYSSQFASRNSGSRRLANHAWQIAGSVVLTGESNAYEGVHSKRRFAPWEGERHIGTWEVAGRISRVNIDANTFPTFADPRTAVRRAAEYAAGINWYPERHAKLLVDYEITRFVAAAVNSPVPKGEHTLLVRLQLGF